MNSPRLSTDKSLPVVSWLTLVLLLVTPSAWGRAEPPTAALSSPGQTTSWVEVGPPDEGFSVQMPKGYTEEPFDMPNVRLGGRTYRASAGLIRLAVSAINSAGMRGNAASRLASFAAGYERALPSYADDRGARMTFERDLELGGFVGRQYRIAATNMRGLVRIYATGRTVFAVEVLGGTEESLAVTRFLNSFRITEPRTEEPAVQGEDRSPTGRGRRTRGGGGGGGDVVIVPIETCACGTDPAQVIRDGRVTRKAILCPLPPLEGTKEADRHRYNGVVQLRLELDASGVITNIEVIEPQPYGLTEKAIEAARQIKFCPALRDGEPATSYLNLDCEYRFKTIQVPAKRRPARARP